MPNAECTTPERGSYDATVQTLIVDDCELVLSRLGSFLESCDGIKVVGTASNGQEALDFVRLHQPELVIMDLRMPVMNGFEAASRIRSEFPDTRVVHISSDGGPAFELASRQSGAQAFVAKSRITLEFSRLLQRLFGGYERRPKPQCIPAHA